MKSSMILLASLLFSISSLAETVNEVNAAEMIHVLKSDKVKELLIQEDGLGNLKGIRYLYSGRASFGPNRYELEFVSSFVEPTKCLVGVDVDNTTHTVISVFPANCKPIDFKD